ncbi:MAG: M56 family metallopeptidase [Acidobacteriaceae bacterium]
MMEKSSMMWMVDYLLNSAWQVALVFLVALLAGKSMTRLYSAVAIHRTWVGALALATVLPACRIDMWSGIPWWHAAGMTGGRVQVAVLAGAAVTAGNLRLSVAMMGALLTLYLAVILYFSGRIVWGLWTTAKLRRNASASLLSEPLQSRWEVLSARLGVTHAALFESSAISGPSVVGSRTILLPLGFIENVEARDVDAALAHELAHLRRCDFFKNVVYAALLLPIAYHPCAWLIQKAVAESRETVCDAMAAEALDGRKSYARSLLRLAMAIPARLRGRATAAVGIFEGNTLERRVGIMMDRGKQLRGAGRVAAMAAVLLLTAGGFVSLVGTHLTVRAADTTAGKTGPIRVPTHVMASRIVSQVQPKYPEAAKKARIQGTVVLNAKIGKDGTVENVKVVSGPQVFRRSSLDAVRQWTYKPFLLNGNPVEVETTLSVVYSLKE